jgi:shikimate kinase
MAAKHLVLVGLMGAGKTTVGRRCAIDLGREFVDTDDVVIALAGGATIDEIFSAGGEPKFRELERQAVADVCASPAPLVIGCGGGTVVDVDNRRRVRDTGFVVWLQAPVAVLADRVGDGATRPLLAGDAVGSLRRLAAMREAAYEASADAAVDTADRSVDDVVDAVLESYRAVTA